MTRRRPLLIAVILAASLSGAAFFMRLGRGPLPLSASPFLREVVEPITIVEALSFDDGGSQGVRFRDAQGVVRDFCLVSFALDFDDPLARPNWCSAISSRPEGPSLRAAPTNARSSASCNDAPRPTRKGPSWSIATSGSIREKFPGRGFAKTSPDESFARVDVVSILWTLQRRNGGPARHDGPGEIGFVRAAPKTNPSATNSYPKSL
jgi:hypothetical protein